ncbi:MAG: hypothetical protein EOP88_10305, partial [Verrucomicrobiaceae bacterium]
MKPAALYLAVPVLALAAGWASGPGAADTPPGAATRQLENRPSRGDEKPWATDDFLRSLTSDPRSDRFFPKDPLMAYLDNWTDAEIRAALDESLADPELLLG